MDIHVRRNKTEIYINIVTNVGTKIYNNLPGFIKEIDHYNAFKKEWGHAVVQWLRYCATSQKVVGSIPDYVIGIFH
jgi:hypothetical protein